MMLTIIVSRQYATFFGIVIDSICNISRLFSKIIFVDNSNTPIRIHARIYMYIVFFYECPAVDLIFT